MHLDSDSAQPVPVVPGRTSPDAGDTVTVLALAPLGHPSNSGSACQRPKCWQVARLRLAAPAPAGILHKNLIMILRLAGLTAILAGYDASDHRNFFESSKSHGTGEIFKLYHDNVPFMLYATFVV